MTDCSTYLFHFENVERVEGSARLECSANPCRDDRTLRTSFSPMRRRYESTCDRFLALDAPFLIFFSLFS